MAKHIDKATRDKALAMFCQHVKPGAICEALGVKADTLSHWRIRGDWVAIRDKTKISVELPSTTLPEIGQDVRRQLASELQAQLALLKRHKPSGINCLSGRDGRAATVKTITDTASTVFGWSAADTSRPLVNIQVLGEVSIEKLGKASEGKQGPLPAEAKVIDLPPAQGLVASAPGGAKD